MTGLQGISADEYEFFTPSDADFADHFGNEANEGVPGEDPYPRLERGERPRMIEGERLLGEWEARKLHRGLMHTSGTPESWAVGNGEWLREELAGLGRVRILLTNLRLFVSIPQTHLSRQTFEVVFPVARKRGDGPAVRPNLKDRAMLGTMARLGRATGSLGEISRDLIGDMPPVAGHLALETIRLVTWPEPGRRGCVVVQSMVRAEETAGTSVHAKRTFLALELAVGEPATAEFGNRLAQAISARWLMADLPAAVRHAVGESPITQKAGELRYESPLFRPVGSTHANVGEAARSRQPALPEEVSPGTFTLPRAPGAGTGSSANDERPSSVAPAPELSPHEGPAMTAFVSCGTCGHGLESTARFCSDCGADQNRLAHPTGGDVTTPLDDEVPEDDLPRALASDEAEPALASDPELAATRPMPSDEPDICRECGSGYEAGARFCEECGNPRTPASAAGEARQPDVSVPLDDEVFDGDLTRPVALDVLCSECGSELGQDDRYCEECGHPRSPDVPVPEPWRAPLSVAPEGATAPAGPQSRPTTVHHEATTGDEALPSTVQAVLPTVDRQLLDAVERAIVGVHAVPTDSSHPASAAQELYESVYRARFAGLGDHVDDLIEAAREAADNPAKRVLTSAYLQENDLQFRDPGIAGLDVRRIELLDNAAESSELEVRLVSTAAGALFPESIRSSERILITIGTELQLMANNNLPEDRATVLHHRGFDFSHLNGLLEVYYGNRIARRLAWGIAMVALTDQRAFGVIFDDEVPGVQRSAERMSMPVTFLEPDGYGSVIAFSAERSAFEDHEIIAPLIGKSRPYVNVMGDCSLAMDTYQVVDDHKLVVKPGKSQIADAVRAFMDT